jgi:hypothetical protein
MNTIEKEILSSTEKEILGSIEKDTYKTIRAIRRYSYWFLYNHKSLIRYQAAEKCQLLERYFKALDNIIQMNIRNVHEEV